MKRLKNNTYQALIKYVLTMFFSGIVRDKKREKQIDLIKYSPKYRLTESLLSMSYPL